MTKNLPIAITAASVAALMGAQANAAQTGSTMAFSSGIVITGIATGTGAGSGTGTFDDAGTLTISSDTFTNIPAFAATATVTSSTTYNGTITGTTFTSDGTTAADTIACTGAALICGQLGTLPTTGVAGTSTVFAVDINTGGGWTDVTVNGPVNLNTTSTLSPVPVPAAAWLFGSALLGLAGVSRKRKA